MYHIQPYSMVVDSVIFIDLRLHPPFTSHHVVFLENTLFLKYANQITNSQTKKLLLCSYNLLTLFYFQNFDQSWVKHPIWFSTLPTLQA